MTKILSVHVPESPALDVVFLHGLDGDAVRTWSQRRTETFWPEWLGQDFDDVAVWTVNYDAWSSGWRGRSMPLQDRAVNLMTQMQNFGIGERPLCFVAHSMGGVLVKEILLRAAEGRTEFTSFATRTRGVVFLATPHTGSGLAAAVDALGLLYRGTAAVEDLKRNEPHLRHLNDRYRNWVAEAGIHNLVFFETRATRKVRVVNESSANPGLAGVTPVPVDADHVDICKLSDRGTIVYGRVRRFVAQLRVPPGPVGDEPPTTASSVRTHRTILVLDAQWLVDDRLDGSGTEARRVLCQVLPDAFEQAGIPWDDCHHEDHHGRVVVLGPSTRTTAPFAESLPLALVSTLRRYNDTHGDERIRVRMALHTGEAVHDGRGVSGAALDFAFRLLDARPLRTALADTAGPLAVIASSRFFEEMIRRSPASDPADYRSVRVPVPATTATAWIRLPAHDHRWRHRRAVTVLLASLVVAVIVTVVVTTVRRGSGASGTPFDPPGPGEQPSTSAVSTTPTGNSASTPPPGGRPPETGARQTHPTVHTDPATTTTTVDTPEPPPEEPTVHIQRDVTLDRYSWVDLDSSAYNPSYGGDLYYGQDANTLEFFFQPMESSQVWQVDGSAQDLDVCTAAEAPQDKIVLDGMPGGSVVCVRTTDGRYSGVKVVGSAEGPSGRSYNLNYLTWERE